MAIHTEIQYAALNDLYLDAKNPRLGRCYVDSSQEEILDVLGGWVLHKLARSYLENGFWSHESLLVIEEELDGEPRLVVVDGNRRLAALIYLHRALNGEGVPKKWSLLVEDREVPEVLFTQIPYAQIDSRQDVASLLGFRHNSANIELWDIRVKAQYIANRIDKHGMSYEEVGRTIGHYISVVQRYYIFHRILLQMEECVEGFSFQNNESRCIDLFHFLRLPGVQKYFGLDMSADPDEARIPVPVTRLDALTHFARWLFGTDQYPALEIQPQNFEDFAKMLGNPKSVRYLENDKQAKFDVAWQLSLSEEDIIEMLYQSRYDLFLSSHRIDPSKHKDSPEVQRALENLVVSFKELLDAFPSIREELLNSD